MAVFVVVLLYYCTFERFIIVYIVKYSGFYLWSFFSFIQKTVKEINNNNNDGDICLNNEQFKWNCKVSVDAFELSSGK